MYLMGTKREHHSTTGRGHSSKQPHLLLFTRANGELILRSPDTCSKMLCSCTQSKIVGTTSLPDFSNKPPSRYGNRYNLLSHRYNSQRYRSQVNSFQLY